MRPPDLNEKMEPDFDKEIDALLRKETAGRTITISEFAGGLHLDADEITAFAEKKVPPGVRDSFIEHFAACDRCRKVLLNAAWLNAEDEPAEQASVAAPVETVLPWYRRLFLYPNLAYVMGGLVVVFAGFIGVSVFTSYNSGDALVSQANRMDEMPTASRGPSEPQYAMNTNSSSAANLANSAANANTAANFDSTLDERSVSNATVANAANTVTQPRMAVRDNANTARNQDVAVTAAPPAAAPPPPRPLDRANEPALEGASASGETRAKRTVPKTEDKEDSLEKQSDRPRPMATPVPAARAPQPKAAIRNDRADTRAAETELSTKKVENLPVTRNRTEPAERKQVRGRTFERRHGVWYDTTYRGQGTINVRRNTEVYRRLDSGLRGIAESLIGTVVTVWNGKAYRIY